MLSIYSKLGEFLARQLQGQLEPSKSEPDNNNNCRFLFTYLPAAAAAALLFGCLRARASVLPEQLWKVVAAGTTRGAATVGAAQIGLRDGSSRSFLLRCLRSLNEPAAATAAAAHLPAPLGRGRSGSGSSRIRGRCRRRRCEHRSRRVLT